MTEDEVRALFTRLFGDDEEDSRQAGCTLASYAYKALLDIAEAQKRMAAAAEFENKRPS